MKLSLNHKVFALTLIFGTPLIGTFSADAATTQLTLTVISSVPLATLTISAPSNVNLGTVSFPSTFTNTFTAPVVVTDTRGGGLGWDSSVLISPLTPTLSGPSIPATVFSYDPGTPSQTGTGTLTFFSAPTPGISTLVVSSAAGGNVSASWLPTLTLTELLSPATGSYTGTVTSSVV